MIPLSPSLEQDPKAIQEGHNPKVDPKDSKRSDLQGLASEIIHSFPEKPILASGRQYKVLCKSQHVRILEVVHNKLLGNGAFKICYPATLCGGKSPQNFKEMVLLEKHPNAQYEAFLRDIEKNVKFSRILRDEAAKAGNKNLFMKYSLVQNYNLKIGIMAKRARSGTLAKYLRKRGRENDALDVKKVIKEILQAGSIMEKVGIYHLDFKLDNIFIMNGSAVVGDFGLSSDDGAEPLRTAALICTPPDLIDLILNQPERPPLEGQKIDSFSVGMLLLELIEGRFFAEEFLKVKTVNVEKKYAVTLLCHKKINDYLNQQEDKMSAPMLRIIRGLLDPDPKQRFSLNAAFDEFQKNEELIVLRKGSRLIFL